MCADDSFIPRFPLFVNGVSTFVRFGRIPIRSAGSFCPSIPWFLVRQEDGYT